MRAQTCLHVTLIALLSSLAACGGSGVEGAPHRGDALGDATGDATGADVNGDGSTDGTGASDGTDNIPDGGSETSGPSDPVLVEIVSPAAGATVSGPTVVKMVPVGVGEREVDFVNLKVNGFTVYTDLKLPTEIVLDTRQHGTCLLYTSDAADE